MADLLTRKTFLRLVDAIQQKQASLKDFRHGEAVEFTINESKTDFLNGEEEVALETLLDNLYEIRFPITRDMYEALCELAIALGLSQKRWHFIQALLSQSGTVLGEDEIK